jgi:predicted ATPase
MEIAQCVAALNAAREGDTGAILYIRGEAGIGKSSLAAETLRRAERLGFTGLRTAVFDFGAGINRDPLRVLALALLGSVAASLTPLEALATFAAEMKLAETDVLALKDLVGLLLSPDEHRGLDAMDPAARLTARGEALASLAIAAAGRNPLFVAFEDVHWADAVVLQGLAMMARAACSASRTVIAITSRVEGDPIAVLQPLIRGSSLVLIELGQLPDQEARTLAASFFDATNPLIEQCVARAGGNPFFLEQLIRHASTGGLTSAVPGSIRSVVTAQVDRLGASEKSALQAAAVLGEEFSIDTLRHILGRPDCKAEALIANRLIRPEKDALQFVHSLIRDGIYSSILHAERRRLHSAAAEWFSGRNAALRAEHLARAGDSAAVQAYLAAAEEQIADHRPEQALGLLERAAGIAEEPSSRAAVSLRRGDLLAELGNSADALAAYDRALANAPDELVTATAKLGKAATLRLMDRNDEALALLKEAEPAFLAESRLAELARLEHLRGNLYYGLGQIAACQAAHERALDYAERSGSIELKASAVGGLGDAAFASGRLVTAERRFTECVELAHRHGFGRVEVANALMLAGISSYAVTALARAERAIAAAVMARQPRAELTARQIAMLVNLWCAQPGAVEAHFERAADIVRQTGARAHLAMNLVAMAGAHRQLGNRAHAVSMLEEALEMAREYGMKLLGSMVLGNRALAAYDDDELRRESLREGERVLAEASHALNALHFYASGIDSCLLAADWGEARRLADCFSRRFAAEAVPLVVFLVERGRLLAELGENGPSASLVQALQRCREMGRRLGYSLFLKLLDEALGDTPG